LRRPEILLLDEATAALDDNTEEFLLNNIWSSGFRTISAAHRLRSATMGDSILYLDHGSIIERGTPSELMNSSDSKFSQLLKMES
jgi:ATP-binding cassette subfamily B protein